ncbi:hypothetical protein SNEBB_007350 [Seison nebaliae]|nr:hypothetical protein SNEBB_007350 [Seison nebaliae]
MTKTRIDNVVSETADIQTDKLDKAKELFDMGNVQEALQLTLELVKDDKENQDNLQFLSSIYIEIGENEEAKKLLEQLISNNEEDNYENCLSYAQLLEGYEAQAAYEKAVEIIQKKIELQPSNHALKDDLCATYCAIAEVYLTDLCNHPNAEEQCRIFYMKSLEVNENYIHGHLIAASHALSCRDKERAKLNVEKSMTLWLDELEELLAEENEHNEIDLLEFDKKVPFAWRMETTKLLIELEEFGEAIRILRFLLLIDSDNYEINYFLGCCYNQLVKNRCDRNFIIARYFVSKTINIAQLALGKEEDDVVADQILRESLDIIKDLYGRMSDVEMKRYEEENAHLIWEDYEQTENEDEEGEEESKEENISSEDDEQVDDNDDKMYERSTQ